MHAFDAEPATPEPPLATAAPAEPPSAADAPEEPGLSVERETPIPPHSASPSSSRLTALNPAQRRQIFHMAQAISPSGSPHKMPRWSLSRCAATVPKCESLDPALARSVWICLPRCRFGGGKPNLLVPNRRRGRARRSAARTRMLPALRYGLARRARISPAPAFGCHQNRTARCCRARLALSPRQVRAS